MSTVSFRIQADFSEVDATVGRMMEAMNPVGLNKVGANRAYRQVKGKYLARFAAQVNKASIWQQWKQGAFGTSRPPGIFTGSTIDSISAESDKKEGRVFLEGMWPKGNESPPPPTYAERADGTQVLNSCVQWGEGAEVELYGIYIKGHGYSKIYIDPEPMETKFYGQRDFFTGSKGREIKFMHLDDEDVGLILEDIDKVLTAAIEGKGVVKPEGGEVVAGEGVDNIPIAEAEAMEAEVIMSDIEVNIENHLAPLRAQGASNAAIERHRKEIEAFLRSQK
jgi:hypothetical protein